MDYNDIVGQKYFWEFTPDTCYIVTEYNGKQNNKHYYTVLFENTKNKYLEERTKVRTGKVKDLKAIKLQNQLLKRENLIQKSRLNKKYIAEYKRFNFENKNILVLDQASNTGYCRIRNGTIQSYNLIQKKYDDYYENAVYIITQIELMIVCFNIDILIFEDVYLGLNANTLEKLAALKGMLYHTAIKNNIEYECIKAQSWKSYHRIEGDRNQQKAKSKEIVKEILGKDVQDDISDAILMGIYVVRTLQI